MSAASSNLQIDGLDQPGIGGNSVARPQEHDIARHEVARRDFALLPIAQDGRRGRGHPAQRLDGALGAVFLHKAQEHRKQHDDGDGDGFDAVPEKGGERRRDEQDDDQHILELLEENRPRRDAMGGLQFVRTVFRKPTSCLGSGQPGGGGLEAGAHFARRIECGQPGLMTQWAMGS